MNIKLRLEKNIEVDKKVQMAIFGFGIKYENKIEDLQYFTF